MVQEQSSAKTGARDWLSETQTLAADARRYRRWLSAPIGLGAHLLVLGLLVLVPLLGPVEPVEPQLIRTFFQFAPPPPPPLRRGSPLEVAEQRTETNPPTPTREKVIVERTSLLPRPVAIPDEILTPQIALQSGVEKGFDDGSLDGMQGGIPGGVLGGVPGGLVGGTIGGTGTELPRFQKPDVGPRPIRMPQPSYTEEAIRKKVAGRVVLRAIIDEKGKVRVIKVLRSVPELEAQAIRIVESRWLFHPATKNGRPIPTLSDLVVRFNIY